MSRTRLIKKGLMIPLFVSLLLHAGILLLIHTIEPVQRSVAYHEAGPALAAYVQLHRLQPASSREPGIPSETPLVPVSPQEIQGGPEGATPAEQVEHADPETDSQALGRGGDQFDAGEGTAGKVPAEENNPHPIDHGSSRVSSGEAASESSPAVIIEENLQRLIRELIEARKRYPEAARRRGEEGEVELRLAVDPDGRLRDCTLYSPSGSTILDRDAVRLVQSIFPIEAPLNREISTMIRINYSLH